MNGRKWVGFLFGIGVILFLAAAVISFLGIKYYLNSQFIPQLEEKFQLKIQFANLKFHPLKGLSVQDLKIQSTRPEDMSSFYSFDEVSLWSAPWTWLGNSPISFQYELSHFQKTPLQITGNGTWDRIQKRLFLDPAFQWPGGSPILFPMKTQITLDFSQTGQFQYQSQLRTASGMQISLQGEKSDQGFLVQPSWIRFGDSFLQYSGDYTTGPKSQTYLDVIGNLDLSNLEKLLAGDSKIFTKYHSKLERIDMGIVLEDQQLIVEDALSDYCLGTLSARGVVNLSKPNRYRLSLRADEIELGVLLKSKETEKSIEGLLTWALSLQGDLADRNSLQGQGFFEIWEGRLWELNLFRGFAKALQTPQMERIVFEEASGRFLIEREKVNFSLVQLRNPQMALEGKGSMELRADGPLDFLVKATFSGEFLQQLGGTPTGLLASLLTNEAGEAITQIHITGTLKSPKYKLQPVAPGQIFKGIFERILK